MLTNNAKEKYQQIKLVKILSDVEIYEIYNSDMLLKFANNKWSFNCILDRDLSFFYDNAFYLSTRKWIFNNIYESMFILNTFLHKDITNYIFLMIINRKT